MPLDFLKRRNNDTPAIDGQPAAPPTSGGRGQITLPEEAVAQEYQLKLYYAGKSSEGVRMQTGPNAMSELPGMLHGLAKSEIEEERADVSAMPEDLAKGLRPVEMRDLIEYLAGL